MLKFYLENLRLYTLYYLLTTICVFAGLYIYTGFELEGFAFLILIITLMFLPEFIRLNKLTTEGYFKLLLKLPISEIEQYNCKFIMLFSGTILIFLNLIFINIIFEIPFRLLENLNILFANIFAYFIAYSPISSGNKDKKIRIIFFFIYGITVFISLTLFRLITENSGFLGISASLFVFMLVMLSIMYAAGLVKSKTKFGLPAEK